MTQIEANPDAEVCQLVRIVCQGVVMLLGEASTYATSRIKVNAPGSTVGFLVSPADCTRSYLEWWVEPKTRGCSNSKPQIHFGNGHLV